MVTPLPSPAQVELEARAARFAAAQPDPDRMMSDVYGEMEEWLLHLGDWDLLLMPANCRWYYFDRVHDDWEDTGYNAGEAVFFLDGDALDAAAVPSGQSRGPFAIEEPELPAAAGSSCVSCGHVNTEGSRFCNNCGESLAGGQT